MAIKGMLKIAGPSSRGGGWGIFDVAFEDGEERWTLLEEVASEQEAEVKMRCLIGFVQKEREEEQRQRAIHRRMSEKSAHTKPNDRQREALRQRPKDLPR